MDWEYIIKGLFIEWCGEYGIPKKQVVFGGFADMEDTVMGMCRHDTVKGKPVGYITLSKHWLKFERMPELLLRTVAWHEYCHAECWVEDGISNQHDDVWKAKRARKPVYHYADYIAKFMWTTWQILGKW